MCDLHWYPEGMFIWIFIWFATFGLSLVLTGLYHLYYWVHSEKACCGTITEAIAWHWFTCKTTEDARSAWWAISLFSCVIWPMIPAILIGTIGAFYLRKRIKERKKNKQ